jgi:hypothetical protein
MAWGPSGRVGAPFRKSLDLRFPSTLDLEKFSTLEPRARLKAPGCANTASIEDSLACSM